MKARIAGTVYEVEVVPYYQEGMFAGFTYESGSLKPGMIVYKPSDLEFIETPPKLKPETDWSAFRMEAAKDAMNGMLSAPQFWQNVWSYNPVNGKCNYPRQIALFAIACADELIKQLKEE